MFAGPAFLMRRSWLWVVAAFAVNFAILWMISFVPVCADVGGAPCEAARPWSSLRPMLMIALAVSFPAMIVLIALLRTPRAFMCLIYAGLVAVLLIVTVVLYQLGYFVPSENGVATTGAGCLICDAIFLIQIAANLGWVFAAVPASLLRSYANRLQRRDRQ
jgi:hypothetical protein